MAKKILILGASGFTGRLLARHLLEESSARLVLAGRNLAKAQALADRLNVDFQGRRATAIQADAGDAHSLGVALQGIDLLLVAAPTTQHAGTVIQAALDSRVDYLDIQLSSQKFARLQECAPQIKQKGLCFITEAGFHPGLPSALVRYAATLLERIDYAITAGYLNMGHDLPYSEAVDELMELFKDYQGQVYKDGRWTKARSYDLRKVDFGGLIGRKTCYSMFLEEMRLLPKMFPTLTQTGFYISETHWLVDWVIMPITWAGLALAPRSARALGKFLWWGMQTFPRPPYLVQLKIEATGARKKKPARVEASISHPDGYELTAIPVVACLLQYLDGHARQPGLWLMGHLVEPVRLFKDMERMGAHVATTII